MRRVTWLSVIALLVSGLALAQEDPNIPDVDIQPGEMGDRAPAKEAWQWTLDERLEERFDPEKNSRRRAEHRERMAVAKAYDQRMNGDREPEPEILTESVSESAPTYSTVIDGKMNPELFLPHELLEGLVMQLRPDDLSPVNVSEDLRAAIERRFGESELFWARLVAVAGRYVKLEYAEPGSDVLAQHLEMCRARAEALRLAELQFGEQEFREFLYSDVAPRAFLSIAGNRKIDPKEELRYEAEGCP